MQSFRSVDVDNYQHLTFNPALKEYFFRNAGIDIQPGMTFDTILSAERVPTWEEFYKRKLDLSKKVWGNKHDKENFDR
jgi:hypothetical protein